MANTSDALACYSVSLSLEISHSHILKERKERREGGKKGRVILRKEMKFLGREGQHSLQKLFLLLLYDSGVVLSLRASKLPLSLHLSFSP